ncbi:hypothetical protein B0H17DRAFT_925098 [Mycena rosella]|uniref:BTB domain-containing protein n=1 Tax=Mycena rosella TaxID=1033263 RepID=A0AAD7GQR6_MYCRO|nr:hypothetical protein B0H17DRAFT_925098 [Mycena rosella]
MEVDFQPSEPRRVEDLWFEDGNLVLQAGNSQFRVYGGLLAARSPIFQDMLSFPQPPDSELVEGCPLVRLPDAEIDVTHFFKAIFIPEYFAPFPALTTSDIVVGCLRLGHKYEVDYLRRCALIHLSSRYRTTLSEYDSRVDPSPDHHAPSTIMSWPFPDGTPTFKICVIQLAREVDALWVLPLAFYDLSTSFNMPTDFPEAIGRGIFHGAVYNGVPTSLSVQDQDSFLQGHFNHTRAAVDIVGFLLDPPDVNGCASPNQCLAGRAKAIRATAWMLQRYAHIPLAIWNDDDWVKYCDDVCPTCIVELKRTRAEARQELWYDLPDMYGLPAWEELEKMKVAAIGNSLRW